MKYTTPPELIDAFSAFVGPEIEDEQIDLTRAALVIARTEYPSFDIEAYAGRIDELGERVGARIGDLRPPHTIAALNHVLFEEAGLRGNCSDYYQNVVPLRRTFSELYAQTGFAREVQARRNAGTA